MARGLDTITGVHADSREFTPHELIADSSTLVGIEVEIENANECAKYEAGMTLWNQVGEGSLRNNGIEIVTPPVLGGDIIAALDELSAMVSTVSHKPVVNERTGLHVHLDFRRDSVQSLFRFMVVYLVFEGTLFKFCEEGREENPYCVPISECDDVLTTLHDIISRSDKTALRALSNWPKYTAANLKTLTTLGTVEIRMHQGTVDSAEILAWINMLLSIKKFAVDSTVAPQVLIDRVCEDPEGYFNTVFGKFAAVPFDTEIMDTMLKGARAAQYMYRSKDIALADPSTSILEALYPRGSDDANIERSQERYRENSAFGAPAGLPRRVTAVDAVVDDILPQPDF